MNNTDTHRQDSQAVKKAEFRMGLWLMLLYLICLALAGLTFPFVGHTTSTQNLIFSIVVTTPFWACLILYLIRVRNSISSG